MRGKGVLGALALVMASSVGLAEGVEVELETGHGEVIAYVLSDVVAAVGAPVTVAGAGGEIAISTEARGLELAPFARLAELLGRAKGSSEPVALMAGRVARRVEFGGDHAACAEVAASVRAWAAAEGRRVSLCCHPGQVCLCMQPAWLVVVGAPDDVRAAAAMCEELRERRPPTPPDERD